MRLLVCVAVCAAILLTNIARAADPYADVPVDHWAYGTLQYLTERGILEGFPDGFFQGDRTLTRYEFAQAVAKLSDTVQSTDSAESIAIMTAMLRDEFSAELAELSSRTAAQGEQVGALEGRIGEMETSLVEQNQNIAGIEERVNGLKPGPDWKGSFLDRVEWNTQDDKDRFLNRIQFKIGYNKQISDTLEAGVRLETNTGNLPNSSTWVLGQDGRTAQIFLDRAYVKYTPSWFGSYLAADGESCTPRLEVYAGLFPNISKDPYYMVLDTDVNFQGLGLVYHFNKDFQILTSASVMLQQPGEEVFDNDTYMLVGELRYNNIAKAGLDAWLGCYNFTKPGNLPVAYYRDNGLQGFDFNNNGAIDSSDRVSGQFNTVKGGLQYTFECVWDKPLAVYSEYMINTASDAEERIAAVNALITPDILFEKADDYGFLVGAQLGKTPEARGDWASYVRYKEIGANAIIDGLGDAGVGGSNVNSLEANACWMWADNCQLGITYFINKMQNAFGFDVPSNRKDMQILQVDWLFKF